MLDLSDDEGITVVPKAAATEPAKAAKPSQKVLQSSKPPQGKQPKAELRKEEAALQQKKKGPPGARGGSGPQPTNVTHPGERSKIGLKKEPHVSTHQRVDPAATNSRGGRVFDRHSGTGRGKEMKKQGAGGHNWGKPGDEPPVAAAEGDAAKKEGEDAAAAAAVPEEPQEPQMTLEEFEAMKLQKRSGDAFKVKEARKVSAEPALQVMKKDEDDDYIKLGSGEAHEQKKKPGHFKAKPTKQVMEIDFKIAREPEPSASPRGFGRGRGGAPRSSPRDATSRGRGRGGAASGGNAAPRQAPVNVQDDAAFPKLGGGGA